MYLIQQSIAALHRVENFFASLASDISAIKEQTETIAKNSEAAQQDRKTKQEMIPVKAEIHAPQPIRFQEYPEDRYNKWKWRARFAVEVITLLAVIFYACITTRIWHETQRSNRIASEDFTISQAANITAGRSDGTVAEIVWPKGGVGNAGLLVYFQNSGHLPARFNWGSDTPIIILPSDPKVTGEQFKGMTTIQVGHQFTPMWRAKSASNTYEWSGTISIAGNSTYQGILWELPSERMLQLINWKTRPFAPSGRFDYCDGFGKHVCKRFSLNYFRSPYNRFFLVSEEDCNTWEMQLIHTVKGYTYLPPCELSRQELQTQLPDLPKP